MAVISDADLIITHTLSDRKSFFRCHCNSMQMITILMIFWFEILKGNFKDSKRRKLTELQFIINFERSKFGFNKDISLLSKYDALKH